MSAVPTGWLCPKCQVVHAPSVLECRCAQVAQPYVVGTPPKFYVGSPTVPAPSAYPNTDWPVTTSIVRGNNFNPNVWRTFTAGNGEAH